MVQSELKNLLDTLYRKYNRQEFIEQDPISVPHIFSKKQDIEIAAFIAAIFSWGQRKTIINKSKEFLGLMDMDPFEFIKHHQESDLKKFLNFKHRTFNDIDALYFISFFKHHYAKHQSLEDAFLTKEKFKTDDNITQNLIHFKSYFFSLEHFAHRTKKHISSPERNSTCKKLCMFLRWMVRKDSQGVDFGLWNKIKPSELICPIDVHVHNTSKQLNLLKTDVLNWKTAVELTKQLKMLDPHDPVKYDFSLFGLGIEQKNILFVKPSAFLK